VAPSSVRRSLTETDLPFGVIAARKGYASRASCSQSFKKLFGYSPQQVRSIWARTRMCLPSLRVAD
jgi:transcriptional regulator GlxA family with amidase domain